MQLKRAYLILGLKIGAPAERVDAEFDRLTGVLEAQIERASAPVVRRRYQQLLARVDEAHRQIVESLDPIGRSQLATDYTAELRSTLQTPWEPTSFDAQATADLGLELDSSPLEVASAYVALCAEIDAELARVPTEASRIDWLEARRQADEAYLLCAAGLVDQHHGSDGIPLPPYDPLCESYDAQPASAMPLPAVDPYDPHNRSAAAQLPTAGPHAAEQRPSERMAPTLGPEPIFLASEPSDRRWRWRRRRGLAGLAAVLLGLIGISAALGPRIGPILFGSPLGSSAVHSLPAVAAGVAAGTAIEKPASAQADSEFAQDLER